MKAQYITSVRIVYFYSKSDMIPQPAVDFLSNKSDFFISCFIRIMSFSVMLFHS